MRASTIRKLQELKLEFVIDTTLNEIVDLSICLMYDSKKRAE